MDELFHVSERKSTIGTELRAGLTTFLAMAYIIAVNPAVLSGAGIDAGALACATCLGAGIMTICMGIFANRPLACASGLGINAMIAGIATTMCGGDWHVAMSVIFLEGVVILLLVLCGLREAIMDAIPVVLRHAISVGLGLFIAMIGLCDAGIITAGAGTLVGLGDITSPTFIVGIISIVVTVALASRNVPGSLLIGIIAALVVVIIALVVFFMIKPFDKGVDDTKGTTIEKVKIDHDDDDVSVKGDPNKFDDDDDDAHDAATISEQNVYDQLSSYYSRLSDLDQQVRDCATTFNTYYLKDDRSSRQSASDTAEALEDQISDLKDEVEDLDVPIDSQNYSSWKDIITLYDDLENRIDVICDAWEISLEYSSPANHKDEIVAPLARDNVAGTNDNKYRLDFEDRYPGAAPVEVK